MLRGLLSPPHCLQAVSPRTPWEMDPDCFPLLHKRRLGYFFPVGKSASFLLPPTNPETPRPACPWEPWPLGAASRASFCSASCRFLPPALPDAPLEPHRTLGSSFRLRRPPRNSHVTGSLMTLLTSSGSPSPAPASALSPAVSSDGQAVKGRL